MMWGLKVGGVIMSGRLLCYDGDDPWILQLGAQRVEWGRRGIELCTYAGLRRRVR
jgi:hypothetical protein